VDQIAIRMSDDLLNKVKRAIQGTGYPLELEIAAIARRNKWVVFHSIEYHDPETAKFRELDLMLYKNIHRRRVELENLLQIFRQQAIRLFQHRP
jgi:hypothetical protein